MLTLKHRKKKRKTIKKKNVKKQVSLINNNSGSPRIRDNFESGSIIQNKIYKHDNITMFDLEFRYDTPNKSKDKSDIASSWFYFCVENVELKKCRFLINKLPILHKDTWKYYNAVYSYDNKNWHYIKNTKMNHLCLDIKFTPIQNSIYIAYYIPFKKGNHNYIKKILSENVKKIAKNSSDFKNNLKYKKIKIGKSAKDMPITCYKVFNKEQENSKKNLWLISGQHPNETIGQYTLMGFIERFIECDFDICEYYNIYIIASCNPDGNYYGNSRFNLNGYNLNRAWKKTIKSKTPEVYYIKRAIETYGCDFLIDLHGDEQSKRHFITYYNEKDDTVEKIKKLLYKKNENFQLEDFYKKADHNPVDYADYYASTILDGIAFTLESAIQHKKYKTQKNINKGILNEPIELGKDLYDAIIESVE